MLQAAMKGRMTRLLMLASVELEGEKAPEKDDESARKGPSWGPKSTPVLENVTFCENTHF